MSKNLAFDYNNLFMKAKLYMGRAFEEDREGEMFPFWVSLALEFLARSTLSKISPTLLADVKSNNDGTHILYALGFETTDKPLSVSISVVLDRLTKIGIEFTDTEKSLCSGIVNQRNVELHSGLAGFEEYPIDTWLPGYYRVSKILLSFQGLTLEDLLGESEAKAAEIMITEDVKKIKKIVLDEVQVYRKAFFEKEEAERSRLIESAVMRNRLGRNNSKVTTCPSCGNESLLSGQLISLSNPKLVGEIIQQESRYLPTQFQCHACGLVIDGYANVKVLELGGQFTLVEELDPVDYHKIGVEDFADYSDYGDD